MFRRQRPVASYYPAKPVQIGIEVGFNVAGNLLKDVRVDSTGIGIMDFRNRVSNITVFA